MKDEDSGLDDEIRDILAFLWLKNDQSSESVNQITDLFQVNLLLLS